VALAVPLLLSGCTAFQAGTGGYDWCNPNRFDRPGPHTADLRHCPDADGNVQSLAEMSQFYRDTWSIQLPQESIQSGDDWPDNWWFNDNPPMLEVIETEPQLVPDDLVQRLTPEILEQFGWRNTPQPTEAMQALMAEIAPLGVSDFAEPVWHPETQQLEFWVDPGTNPAPIFTAAEKYGVPASDIVIQHRQFPMAQLARVQDEVWANGVNGVRVNASSIRHDGSGIDVGLLGFDGSPDQQIAVIDGVPIYPTFGSGFVALDPFPVSPLG
jgi:hypothetical protein